jgi:lysophospholipase
LNISGIDTSSYIDDIVNEINGGNSSASLPRIGIAMSGGGYRTLMNSAGAIAAFDNRTANSTGQGQLGGLLQAATYLSGLSGGGWLVGSLYAQNFTTVESVISATSGFLSTLWQFNESIFDGPYLSTLICEKYSLTYLYDNLGPAGISATKYYDEWLGSVQSKKDAGFNTTITDYWGRALSYQLVNASDGGPGMISFQKWLSKH